MLYIQSVTPPWQALYSASAEQTALRRQYAASDRQYEDEEEAMVIRQVSEGRPTAVVERQGSDEIGGRGTE